MSFQSFEAYLKSKKMGIDPKKGLVGDEYEGALATKSEDDGKEPQEYSDKPEKGFVLKADNDDSEGLASKEAGRVTVKTTPLGSKPPSPVKKLAKAKLTSEEFVGQTAGLSDEEFVKFMTDDEDVSAVPTITDLYGNEFTPDPNQTISYLCGLMTANPRTTSKFVRELKRRGGLESFLWEVYNHPEAYEFAVEAMSDDDEGVDVCDRFTRAMNDQYMREANKFLSENVSPSMDIREPWGKDQQGGPQGQPSKGNPAAGGGSNPGPSQWDTPPDPNYAKGNDPYATQGSPPMHDIGGGGGMPPAGGGPPNFGNGPVVSQGKRMMKEYKGSLAFRNLGESMVKYEDMRDYLSETCAKCNKPKD